jgi:ATP-dependent exoDNAse (exonuclease V) beta subunit
MARKREYDNEWPSVTQVLSVLRKIGLEAWFKANSPAFIKAESEKGKLIGTQIHEAIQSHIEQNEVKVETEYPDEVMTALKSFMLFKKEHPEITLKSSEQKMTSLVFELNGTLDVLGVVNDELVIGDWKTSNAKDKDVPDIYDEYKYQVSAYVKLYNEVNNANINKAFIVALAKDKIAYNFTWMDEVDIEGCFTQVFYPCLTIYNYQRSH